MLSLIIFCSKTKDNRKTNQHLEPRFKKSQTPRRRSRHECDYCAKLFTNAIQLALHVRTHTNESYVCNFCGEPQLSAQTLDCHLKKFHKDLSFCCDVCKRYFTSPRSLKLHSRTHGDKRNNVCLVCDKNFSSKAYLKIHAKSHAVAKRKKNVYNCAECEFSTFYSSNLVKHVRVHAGENKSMCHICGKLVVTSYMNIHMEIHSGDKPHLCEVCGKSFSVFKYLVAHERIHTGFKPFKCQICEKRFNQETALKLHLKGHKIIIRNHNDDYDEDDD